MVADMLEQHHHQAVTRGNVKRKRGEDDELNEQLHFRKLSSLAGNNNDVTFVLEDHSPEDALQDDPDEVSSELFFIISFFIILKKKLSLQLDRV